MLRTFTVTVVLHGCQGCWRQANYNYCLTHNLQQLATHRQGGDKWPVPNPIPSPTFVGPSPQSCANSENPLLPKHKPPTRRGEILALQVHGGFIYRLPEEKANGDAMIDNLPINEQRQNHRGNQ
jgi:hypothetical protein